MSRCRITVDNAIHILEELGCADDPIWMGGVETTPKNLEFSEWSTDEVGHDLLASQLRIRFSTGLRDVTGHLWDMVQERLGLPHKAKPWRKKHGRASTRRLVRS